ncbi:MAG: hypothetical protein AB7E79_12590 [Rhodospirillaceae bacterium]
MQDDAHRRPVIFRQRAQELRTLATTISAPLRDDLIRVALEWERLAESAERETATVVGAAVASAASKE